MSHRLAAAAAACQGVNSTGPHSAESHGGATESESGPGAQGTVCTVVPRRLAVGNTVRATVPPPPRAAAEPGAAQAAAIYRIGMLRT
eukprot:533399-Hanusia_phi.AAC.1